jgi:hypothetical protein
VFLFRKPLKELLFPVGKPCGRNDALLLLK